MKPPKSSLFSFGKKEQRATPPEAPAPAKPSAPAKAPATPSVAPPSTLTLDDVLVAQLAVMCCKDAVPQNRFDELLHRARMYVIAKKD